MFISNTLICVQYVDNFIWFYRDQKELDKVLQSLWDDGDKYNWEIGVDGTVTEYLGIVIEEVRTDKGNFGYQLTQEGLIKNILSTTGITDCNIKVTPTSV